MKARQPTWPMIDHRVLICNTVEPYLPASLFDVTHARVHCTALHCNAGHAEVPAPSAGNRRRGGLRWCDLGVHERPCRNHRRQGTNRSRCSCINPSSGRLQIQVRVCDDRPMVQFGSRQPEARMPRLTVEGLRLGRVRSPSRCHWVSPGGAAAGDGHWHHSAGSASGPAGSRAAPAPKFTGSHWQVPCKLPVQTCASCPAWAAGSPPPGESKPGRSQPAALEPQWARGACWRRPRCR